MEAEQVRVLVVDDHEVVRRGLVDILEQHSGIDVCGEAGTGAAALEQAAVLEPDVVVLDVRLPDVDGVTVCRELRSRVSPPPRCLMLTSYPDDDVLVDAVVAGASGFLLKQVRGLDLVDAVRTVASGGSLMPVRATALVVERLREARSAPPAQPLTDREQRVFELIGDGLSNRQIADRMELAEKTVKNHVSSLLRKLGLQRRTQVAVLADRARAERPDLVPTG